MGSMPMAHQYIYPKTSYVKPIALTCESPPPAPSTAKTSPGGIPFPFLLISSCLRPDRVVSHSHVKVSCSIVGRCHLVCLLNRAEATHIMLDLSSGASRPPLPTRGLIVLVRLTMWR